MYEFRFAWQSEMVSPYCIVPGGEALDKLRVLSSAVGPRDRWRAKENRTASAGNTLPLQACMEASVDESMLECWFRGAERNFDLRPL